MLFTLVWWFVTRNCCSHTTEFTGFNSGNWWGVYFFLHVVPTWFYAFKLKHTPNLYILTLKWRKSTAFFISEKYLVISVLCLLTMLSVYGAKWHISSKIGLSVNWQHKETNQRFLFSYYLQIWKPQSLKISIFEKITFFDYWMIVTINLSDFDIS